ncbi:DUF5060 domain-containing protein [Flexithrix dorotheae]|uniref:DUF5060 domain-containing protein n=1 Tax=Flexithrix dorotheae TaxID=70993 RepID=UPI00037E55DC|nr:DUF5060 domain-containing protein [Flexithrix dorotheae]
MKLLIFISGIFFLIVSCSPEQEEVVKAYQQWHTITLPFDGPETAENAPDNPFLNYRLQVTFQHQDGTEYDVRGFYAADGNAAETSAKAGKVWKVRFTPDQLGNWNYKAFFYHGEKVALSDNLKQEETIKLENAEGKFKVISSEISGKDFRGHGRIEASNGFFKFKDSNNYWLKGGTNSPENLLAFKDFDDTYRMLAEARKGEAAAPKEIHEYKPHLKDWNDGDPTWQNGKGKALIGGINYLASKGMNSIYFLTLNINGDGKDVWPYHTPDDFTRFDVSKLAQWEIVFNHMQEKGILMHVVLQETENETMLDNGDTGTIRKLYLQEMIARFGHHLALVWNLGEENGPAPFSPIGQNDAQRKAMTSFIKESDPYQHPVLLHTHSHDPVRSVILDSIIGFKDLDGLSLQQDKREKVFEVVQEWKEKARNSGHEWLITMDEIGMWHTGAQSDSLDPQHETLRGNVLWGTLMSGGAGVEWYFGARNLHTDLNSEDWRRRDRLWELTNIAVTFFNTHLPYWEMWPAPELVKPKGAFCFRKTDEIYAIYLPEEGNYSIDLSETSGEFQVHWFNPLKGGDLSTGSLKTIEGGKTVQIGNPPEIEDAHEKQDWVVLLKRS